jgi:hypothetical protein
MALPSRKQPFIAGALTQDSYVTAFDDQAALGDELNRRRIDRVLDVEDPPGQRLLGVVRTDDDGTLQDDRSVVGLLVDEVDGGTGDADPVLQRLTLGV